MNNEKIKNLSVRNCPDDKLKVEFMVFNNFISALKSRKRYLWFRGSVGFLSTNPISAFLRSFGCFKFRNGCFSQVGEIKEMLSVLGNQVGNFSVYVGSDKGLQQHIANCTNVLLHEFVEPHMRDFDKLSELGEEIFNATCSEIFGEGFKDLTATKDDINANIGHLQNQLGFNGDLIERLGQIIRERREIPTQVNDEVLDWDWRDEEDWSWEIESPEAPTVTRHPQEGELPF